MISFGSDNHSGVHPLLFEEMLAVNKDFAASYEQDPWSQELRQWLIKEFQAEDVAMVFNGTAANVIGLQVGLDSYNSVLCSTDSHLHMDECGAPEKIAGVKLIAIECDQAKLTPELLQEKLIRRGDQHFSQVKMVSITQPTEYGTLYSLEELSAIKDFCKKHTLLLHMDGARLPNAAVALGLTLGELTQGVDILSFGGAKNGLMLGEFVVVKNKNLKKGLKFFRKQSLQLPSKTRFLAAPFLKYLKSGLWKEIAQHENSLAQSLKDCLKEIDGIQITQPTQANSVFCTMPREMYKKIRKKYFFYVWDEKTFEVRLMTSFATQKEHINQFIDDLKNTKETL